MVTVLTSANASQSNVVSYKIHKSRPKGLSHNKMGPHAVLQLNPKPETVYEENMQPLINASGDWRAEKGQAQAGRPRPGEPAWARPPGPQLHRFGPTQLKPTSSDNQERTAKRRQTTDDIPRPAGLGEAGRPPFFVPRVQPSRGRYSTAMHEWTAWLSS